jgi:hypothetical protein
MAIITTEQRNELLGLIVTMFQAAPGEQALGDVVGAREAGASLESIANALSTKALFSNVYSATQTADEFADAVVAWLLPASTPSAALTWSKGWVLDRIAEGGGTPTAALKASVLVQAAQAIMATENTNYAAAQALMQNRIDVSNYYSVVQLQPTTTLLELQDVLDGVTADPASVDAAKADIDANLVGDTHNLTVGVDTLTGSAGVDVFNADARNNINGLKATTFSGSDTLDGGAGSDTLNITVDGSNNSNFPTGAKVTNIETINIQTVSGSGWTGGVDASKFVGATAINQIGAANTVNNLGANTTAGFEALTGVSSSLTVNAVAGAATVALNDVAGSTVALVLNGTATNKLGSVTISGNNVDDTDDVLDLSATNSAATLVLNSAVDVNVTALAATTTTLDASASAGDIKVALNTLRDISTGSGDDVATLGFALTTKNNSASLNSGAGDDTLTVAVTGLNASTDLTVNAGEGDDFVNVTTLLGTIGASATQIDGGDGNDTVRVNNGAALNPGVYDNLNLNLVGFENLEFDKAVTVDASRISGYTSIAFRAGTNTATKVAADQELIVDSATQLTASGSDDINVTVNNDATVVINAGGVANVSATVVNDGDASDEVLTTVTLQGDSTDAVVTLASATKSGVTGVDSSALIVDTTNNLHLATLTVSGDGSATVTSGPISVTTSDTTHVLVDIDTSDLTGGLALTSTQTEAETISLGSGADVLKMHATSAGAVDTIIGFDTDEDTLELDDGGASVGSLQNIGELSGNGTLNQLLSAYADTGTYNAIAFTFGGDTYVFLDTGVQNDSAEQGLAYQDSDVLVKLVGIYDLDDLIGQASII